MLGVECECEPWIREREGGRNQSMIGPRTLGRGGRERERGGREDIAFGVCGGVLLASFDVR